MAGCVEIQNDLSAYLDGELPAGERGALEAHLRGCAPCQAALSELKSVAVSLNALPKVKAPSNFAARLSQELRKEAVPAASRIVPLGSAPAKRNSWVTPGLMSAAALVAVAVLVFAVLPGLQKTPPPATGVAMNQAPEAAGARKAPASARAEEPEQLTKSEERRKHDDKPNGPGELADRKELLELGGKDAHDSKDGRRKEAAFKAAREPNARGRQQEWAAGGPLLEDQAKAAPSREADANKDKMVQQRGEQKQFGAPPAPQRAAPAKPGETTGQPFADADNKKVLALKDDGEAKGNADRIGAPAAPASAPPPAAAAARNEEALRRSSNKGGEKPGQGAAAADPGKPAAGAGAGEGGGGAPGKAAAANAAKPEAKAPTDAGPAKKSAKLAAGIEEETAQRKLAENERKLEKSSGGSAPATAAPAPTAAAKFRANVEPLRLTLKSTEPVALAARLRKTAAAAGATVVVPQKEQDKAPANNLPFVADDTVQEKRASKQIVITLSAPAHKREALLKELQALQQAPKQADSKDRGALQAEADEEPAKKQAPAEAKEKARTEKKDAAANSKADAPAAGDERAAVKLSKNDDAAREAQQAELLKSVEETIQIIIVVEPE